MPKPYERTVCIDARDELHPPSTLLGQFLLRVFAMGGTFRQNAFGISTPHDLLTNIRDKSTWFHPAAEAVLSRIDDPTKFRHAVAEMEDAHASLPTQLRTLVSGIGSTVIMTSVRLPERHLDDAFLLANAGVHFVPPLPERNASAVLSTEVTPDQ